MTVSTDRVDPTYLTWFSCIMFDARSFWKWRSRRTCPHLCQFWTIKKSKNAAPAFGQWRHRKLHLSSSANIVLADFLIALVIVIAILGIVVFVVLIPTYSKISTATVSVADEWIANAAVGHRSSLYSSGYNSFIMRGVYMTRSFLVKDMATVLVAWESALWILVEVLKMQCQLRNNRHHHQEQGHQILRQQVLQLFSLRQRQLIVTCMQPGPIITKVTVARIRMLLPHIIINIKHNRCIWMQRTIVDAVHS